MRSYTLIDDAGLTEVVVRDVDQCCAAIVEAFEGKVCSLALVGGYGRGEGGAKSSAAGWRPKNNYDFLVVLPGRISPGPKSIRERHSRLKMVLDARLHAPFEASYQREHRVRRAPPIMFFQDVRKASRTLYGREIVSLLPESVLAPLPAIEAVRVLRTRSMLLLSCGLRQPYLGYRPDAEQKRIWLSKAVIGYGDALMILLGCYETLYVQKRDVMRNLGLSAVFSDSQRAQTFRELHWAASCYRLADEPSPLLEDWARVRDLLGEVARWVYGRWLGYPDGSLSWEDFRAASLPPEPDWIRKLRNIAANLRSFRTARPANLLAVHPRDSLIRVAPLLLFDETPAGLDACRRALRMGNHADPEALRDACLRLCARYLV